MNCNCALDHIVFYPSAVVSNRRSFISFLSMLVSINRPLADLFVAPELFFDLLFFALFLGIFFAHYRLAGGRDDSVNQMVSGSVRSPSPAQHLSSISEE